MAAAAATARLVAASLSLDQQQRHRQLPLQLQALCLQPSSQSSCSSRARRPQEGLWSTHGSHLCASACGARDRGRSSPPSPTCAFVISSSSTAVPLSSSASPRLSRSQKLKPWSSHSGDLNWTSLRVPYSPRLSGRRAGHHVVVAAGSTVSAAAAAAAAGAAAKAAGAASVAASSSTGAGLFASISSSISTGIGGGVVGSGVVGSGIVGSGVVGSGIVGSSSAALIASALFTLCTAGVMPFYTLMLFAPGRPLTEKAMRSNLPYIVLGAAYLYLLSLSWTPNTLRLMFASKYWLPELPGITQMFSSTLTVASAWIHLLAVDLFSARHVYLEGLQLGIETRHSIILCLMFGPIGILCHSLTKAYVAFVGQRKEQQKRNDKSYKGPSL